MILYRGQRRIHLTAWSLCYLRWKIRFVILCTLNLLGLAALGIYDYQTYYSAQSVHFPHYHCENGTSIIPYQTAMKVELAFVCSKLLSRLIFVALISLRRLKRVELKDIIWKVVWNDRVCTWPPLLFYGLSFWRFVLFLLGEDHLAGFCLGFIVWGRSPEWPKATSFLWGSGGMLPRKCFEMNMR